MYEGKIDFNIIKSYFICDPISVPKLNTQMGPGRESDDFLLRINSSIGELLLLLYKSGFYRRE